MIDALPSLSPSHRERVVENRLRQAGEMLGSHKLSAHISSEYGPFFEDIALLLVRRANDRGTFADNPSGDNAAALRRIWRGRMMKYGGHENVWLDGQKLIYRYPEVLEEPPVRP